MNSRVYILIFFVVLSIGSWYFLEGEYLRDYLTLIPLLFLLQVLLNDFIESYLFEKLNAFWFRFLIAPGTVAHELSHAVAAKLTGCKILNVSLFSFSARSSFGSVEYTQSPGPASVLRCVIVAFAPFFGCGVILLALINFALGPGAVSPSLLDPQDPVSLFSGVSDLVHIFYSQFALLDQSPYLLFVLYLQVCFGLGAAPSKTDFKAAFDSALKHPLASIATLAFFVFLGFLSTTDVLGPYFSGFFDWALLVLVVSVSLLFASIPVIVVLAKFMGISVPKKLASLLFASLAYPLTGDFSLSVLVFCFFVLLFGYSWIILRPER